MAATPVFEIPGTINFSGENDDFYNADHHAEMEVERGTIALTFRPTDISGRNTLFSKDGRNYDDGGHLTAWVNDGRLEVRQQSDDESETLKTDELTISKGQTYHLAVTFGSAGLKVYLDGVLVLAEPEMRQGLEENWREFLVGASGVHRSHDGEFPRDPFAGQISDLQLYDKQLKPSEIIDLAGDALGPMAEHEAQHVLDFEALAPAFTQLHHGSDAARELAAKYGLGGDHGDHGGGHMTHDSVMAQLGMIAKGGSGDDVMEGGDDRDAMNGGMGDDTLNGNGGDDVLQGYYGDDILNGGAGHDVLDGGHGQDVLNGGNGNDLLIARSDAREPEVYPDPDRDEGDPFNELTNGKLYPDQPLPADDVLTGGAGADVFYIQTQINAKARYIREHTNDDGTINWHGVAGENDNIHDHWVDAIGYDMITDFSRSEGDRILIEGHTTEILSVTYGDADGDGAADHSIVEIYSQQGNGGGAHDEDRLGKLFVFGDLITESDIEADAGPAYGAVKTIDGLREALTPLHVSEDNGPLQAPETLDDGAASSFVFFLVDTQTDEVIARIKSGDVIDGALIDSRAVSIMAEPVGMEVGSVRLRYDGHEQTENVSPYALFGDHKGDFKGDGAFGRGQTTIHVEAYEEEKGKGALLAFERLTFEVSDDVPTDGGAASNADDAHDGHDMSDGDDEEMTGGHDMSADDADSMAQERAQNLAEVEREDVSGSQGDDILAGVDGDERLDGGEGDDIVRGGDGSDELLGGVGEDILRGGVGEDILSAGDDDDIATGDRGEDIIDGDDGDDIVRGGADDDIVDGGEGDDVVIGDRGDDIMSGGGGEDILKGGQGDDIIDGGTSDDILIGGAGLDIFSFAPGSGSDIVRDFSNGEDTIDLSDYGFATIDDVLALSREGAFGVRIRLNDEDDIMLRKTELSDLDASDFIL